MLNTYTKKIPLLILFLLLIAGCATIIHGSKQDVGISSSPTGAQVTIDNQSMGKTPITASLSRKDQHTLRIELNGYQPYETQLTRKVSGWIAGNILFGGLVGLAVDAIDGAMYQLSPAQVEASMAQGMSQVKNKGKDKLFITFVLKPDPNWKKVGQLKKL